MRVARNTFVLLVALAAGCASAPREARPAVRVYEADMASPPAARRLPPACRLLGSSGPVDQMESERAMDDPYKRQRRETADKGGNVLLVLSERTVTRPNLDCPSGDASPDCLRLGQSWYRVQFEQYACSVRGGPGSRGAASRAAPRRDHDPSFGRRRRAGEPGARAA